MWAKVSHSNNNPNIVAQFYLDTVTNVGGQEEIKNNDHKPLIACNGVLFHCNNSIVLSPVLLLYNNYVQHEPLMHTHQNNIPHSKPT